MLNWSIKEEGIDVEGTSSLGNKFLIGNGYMGIRGTLEEYEADKMPAINLAGIYDKSGEGWREPINLPNACYSYLKVDGEKIFLPDVVPVSHSIELDYRHGIFRRNTTWKTERGIIHFSTERFASMADPNLICMRFKVNTDFHADVEIVTGIDCDVWDLNGPHIEGLCFKENSNEDPKYFTVSGYTHENHIPLAVAEGIVVKCTAEVKNVVKGRKILHRVCIITNPGKDSVVEKVIYVCTGKECDEPVQRAKEQAMEKMNSDYSLHLNQHIDRWETLWKHSQVIVKGDDVAMLALNYSLYHLHSIAPRQSKSLSIPARGLSGQTYKGAVFWDTEMFMLDFFLMTDPPTAKTLIQYRIDTLDGALKKASSYGYEGAFYPWESQEGGFDACSDYNVTDVFTGRPMRTFFRDKQVHITAAVVYGILRYIQWTGDESILDEKCVKTIIECAKFYYSLLIKHVNKDCYEIHDVIGPDEYHERINNNGYTNRMAKFTFEQAAMVIEKARSEGKLPSGYDYEALIYQFKDAAEKIYLPTPSTDKNREGVIQQFDGYFDLEDVSLSEVRRRLLHEKEYWGGAYGVASHTQIIKQADVITWLNLFSNEFSDDILRKNWDYYESRTEHGSSLSAGMYSMLACKIGEPNRAYPFFLKSATADLEGGGKEWAGLIYIGGTHPAAAGAAYMTAIEGFAGIKIENGELVCNPSLPNSIEEMQFNIFYLGKEYEVKISKNSSSVRTIC